jgi:two-component system, LytTR family, sensor kinase
MGNSKNIKNWINQNQTPLIHILVWAVFFLLPIIFITSDFSEPQKNHHNPDEFFSLNIINKLFKIGLFYLNTQLLIPKLLYPKRYIQFVLSQVLSFAFILTLDFLFFKLLNINHPFHFARSAYHNISLFLFVALSSIVFKLVWDKAKAEEQQKENIKTELSFLRSQISPHFLFNVLNNIVAMVRLKSDNLEDTVVKLSTLLQYMLYETDEEKVLLRNEIEYLESYIDLQSQRFGNKIQIIRNISVKDNYQTIEPMLLIPFVENAFKHGYGLIKNPVIDIALKTDSDVLIFEVKNKFDDTNLQKDKTSGIGLTNVKRRLELLYPASHQLEIIKNEHWFMISLKLQLKP